MIAVVVAVLALIACGVMGLLLRSLGSVVRENHRATVRAVAQISANTRRVDDRLTYYERRPDGLKGLRAGYDKRLAHLAKERAEIDDAAPEGTAQSERLIG